eukprot:TRINITY_DN1230_c0_g1_i1.p1 TRINITY_DN1230_c0_g1~~TRINITY_DN1230_c0_g1_i1.p1  ORF type:complete len:165 (+),score=24.23 TRINITY_DN1230_c0_g1_i1:205-699(+)
MNRDCVVHVLGPTEVPIKTLFEKEKEADVFVNCTSRSTNEWSKQLSPFFLGPVELYGGQMAMNMENAWQYTKVYKHHTDNSGKPTPEYFKWAKEGWNNNNPVRFPMGRGAKPEYSLWDGQRLGYIEARKKIYAPLYAAAVEKTEGYQQLKKLYDENSHLYLWYE